MNNVKNSIGWADYTWNPVVGCKRGCPYCYAYKIHQRFNPDTPFEQITNYDERLEQPLKVKKPSRIFVGSMSDIEYWSKTQMKKVLDIVKQCPQHTFMFLTKNGDVYKEYDFPVNCWLGQTIVNRYDYKEIKNNNLKFISFEPLLDDDIGNYRFPADWYIIGGLTPKQRHTKEGAVRILSQAEYFNIPVFIKDNAHYPVKMKEFPEI